MQNTNIYYLKHAQNNFKIIIVLKICNKQTIQSRVRTISRIIEPIKQQQYVNCNRYLYLN